MSNDTQETPRRLSGVLELYCQKKKREKNSTQRWRRQAWRHLIAAVGNIALDDFCYADIEDFETYLYSQDFSQNGVRSYLKAVGTVIAWSVRRGLRSDNPFVGYKYPRRIEYDIFTYNQTDADSLRAAAHTSRWQALIEVALSAGLRRGEALNLRIEDVDFERNTITIQPHKGTWNTWPWRPKSDRTRKLPLTPAVSRLFCEILEEEIPDGQPYLLLTDKQYDSKRDKYRQGALTERERLTPDSGFDSAFGRIRQRAGLTQGTYHDLRRTCLTRWSRIPGLSIGDLHKLAGHAEIETTMKYYIGVRADVLDLTTTIGATGLEPATS